MSVNNQYTEDNIRSLDWKEHIRMRPGMYIGKLGDGSSPDDGIYILLKEVLDNSIDEFVMGNGKTVEVTIRDKKVSVRDYGRGIPLGKVVDCVSKINTGAKYDSKAFKKSVGLNGVGTKAVNALSSFFRVESNRDNKSASAEVLFFDSNQIESRPDDGFGQFGSKPCVDILSNGFKLREANTSGVWTQVNNTHTYIYCAWAEAPAVNLYGAQANAR